ncbi:MAG: hypothetical protein V4692_13085 [Bdellovibrionota bacterium]
MSGQPQAKLDWNSIEVQSLLDANYADQRHDVEVHLARSIKQDYRKAEALCLLQPTDLLQTIRTLISRGHTDLAMTALETYRENHPELEHDCEWLLEIARLLAYTNQWTTCLSQCQALLGLQLPPITLMTSLQTRSVALFELGLLHQALLDIDRIQSLDRLYPGTQVAHYAELSRVKILAIQGDLSTAKTRLKQIWDRSLKSKTFNLDHVLTLLRIEGFVAMSEDEDATRYLESAAWISNRLGDDLHSALSRFELLTINPSFQFLYATVTDEMIRFRRIQVLFNEISETSQSTTAKTLFKNKEKATLLPRDLSRGLTHLVLPAQLAVVEVTEDGVKAHKLAREVQTFTAYCFIAGSNDGVSKSALFSHLFGNQKYVPHLHDPTIYQIVSRIRKTWNVKIETANGLLQSPTSMVAGCVR